MIVKDFAIRALAGAVCSASLLLGAVHAQPAAPAANTTGSLVVDPEATAVGANKPGARERLLPESAAKIRDNSVPKPNVPLPSSSSTTRTAVNLRDIPTSKTVVLATWNGGNFTNQDLSATLQLRRPPSAGDMTPAQALTAPLNQLRKIVEDLVYEQAVYQKAKTQGLTEKTPEIAEKLKNHREDIYNRILFQRRILPRQLEMDEKDALKYYEENKETLYTVPGELLIRALNVPTYVLYTVKEGDTLASIAQAISGDVGAVSRFLRAEGVAYPRLPLSGVRGPVPTVEAKPGEKLLVPLADDQVTSAENVARQIREKLAMGVPIATVVQQFPQVYIASEGKPFPPDLDGAYPAIVQAVEEAKATTTSQVARTPAGFTIVQIADRQPTRTLTFQEVAEEIVSKVTRDEKRRERTNEELRRETFDQLAPKYQVKLNEEALKRSDHGGADPLTGATPIVSGPGFTYTLDEFLKEIRARERTWPGYTYEERVNVAKAATPVIRHLFAKEAEAQGLEKLPAVLKEMESKAIQEITAEYLRRQQEQYSKPTESQLREYYQQHQDRYTSAPRVTLREITRRINFNAPPAKRAENIEKAKQELAALRSRIQSQADFEQAARRESHSLSTRSRGGLVGTMAEDFRGDMFRNQIAQLKPGEVSEPFLYGSEVVIIRLDDRQPSRVLPFEEVLPFVRRDYLQEVPGKLREQYKEKVLSEAGFESKL